MELRRAKKEDYIYLKHVYDHAFPPEERAPFRRVWRCAGQGKADFLSIHIHGKCCGMAYLVRRGDLVYFFYLALDPRVRGRGIGTKVLKAVKRKCEGKRLFFALEQLDPKAKNYEIRVRRHALYRRCGFVDLPYVLHEAGVVYAVMGNGGMIRPKEYSDLMDYHMGKFMRKLLHMRLVRLPENAEQ